MALRVTTSLMGGLRSLLPSLCFYAALGKTKESKVPPVMNEGGVPYQISNPAYGTGEYSTNFNENALNGPVEHFDVYGEVRTKYSQVYWTRNEPINLPPELVARFDGKVMAITGYEIDQVTHAGLQPGSTTTASKLGGFSCFPECPGEDKSVPIYNAYNHHYYSWIMGKDAEVHTLEKPKRIPNPTDTEIRGKKPEVAGNIVPTSVIFIENSGGEYRKSYHGYPSGFAQLVASPTQWVVEPMQIDTHNRNFGINDEVGYQPWFVPKAQQNNMTDRSGRLSPLIECPCTDRVRMKTVTLENGTVEHWWAYGPNGTFNDKWEGYPCMEHPRSDMATGGIGVPGPNPACLAETYHGGVRCCRNGYFLTDLDQEALIPDQTDVYFLKWRYYFQEYKPSPVSHIKLSHWVFLIDQQVNDYEEECADCGTNGIGVLTAKLKAREIGLEDAPPAYTYITPMVMTPHCHAPSCIREQLWNADTGELLCSVDARYGSPEYGSTNKTFNEESYLSLPPCVFGYQPGLREPFSLLPDTNLYALKYFNKTYRHLGQMAQWAGMLTYDHQKPYFFV